jgi:enterochelin esterase-like enzyme
LIEWPDRVIFLFRGEVQDVAIAGDLQGAQREEQMKRIAGTDLYYHIGHLEPDARIHYRFVKNYEELIADPLNPRQTKDRRGGALSWMAMPGWIEPQYLQEAPAAKKGTLETHELKSTKLEGASVKVEVYLPAGYAAGSSKYPVVYLHDQGLGRSLGTMQNAFDNLNGVSIQPVIAVFLPEIKTAAEPIRDPVEQANRVAALITEEVVPFVDSKYRTLTDAKSRAIAGGLEMGTESLLTALNNPQVFGAVAVHSAWIDTTAETALKAALRNPGEQPVRIYMDWGLYDARSASDGWDLRRANRNMYTLLQEKGFRPAGGETHESYGWASWRNQAANWLVTFFSISNS